MERNGVFFCSRGSSGLKHLFSFPWYPANSGEGKLQELCLRDNMLDKIDLWKQYCWYSKMIKIMIKIYILTIKLIINVYISLDLLKPRSACPWPPGDLLICFMFRDPPHKVLGPRAAHPGFLPSIFWHCCTFSAHKLFTSNYKFAFAGSSSYSSMNNMLTKP